MGVEWAGTGSSRKVAAWKVVGSCRMWGTGTGMLHLPPWKTVEKSLEEFGIGPDRAFESACEQGTCDDTQPCVLAVVHIHRTTL